MIPAKRQSFHTMPGTSTPKCRFKQCSIKFPGPYLLCVCMRPVNRAFVLTHVQYIRMRHYIRITQQFEVMCTWAARGPLQALPQQK